MNVAKDPYYGLNDNFSRNLQDRLYQDNSMEKKTRQARIIPSFQKKQAEIIQKLQHLARYRRKLSRQTQLSREILTRQREVHASAILLDARFEWAAITIQRHVKGYLQRIRYNKLVISQDLTIVSKRLLKLKNLMYKVFYMIGPKMKQSVLKIQTWYRMHLAKKKFKARKLAYMALKYYIKKKMIVVIQRTYRGYHARLKYKIMKEDRNRNRLLAEIKERLGLIKVKKLWMKVRFNWRTICKKYGLPKCRRANKYHMNSREAAYCCFKDIYSSNKSGRKVSVDIQNRCYYKPQVKVIYPIDQRMRDERRVYTSMSYRSKATTVTTYSRNCTPTPPPKSASKSRYSRKGAYITSRQNLQQSPQPKILSSFEKYDEFSLFSSYESIEKHCRASSKRRPYNNYRSFCL